jgi:glycosyltransferase involved in cell wall biosynthesis
MNHGATILHAIRFDRIGIRIGIGVHAENRFIGSNRGTAWAMPKISVNVVTHNRTASLARLLRSLAEAHYLGDEVPLTLNIESGADEGTLELVESFEWIHGPKRVRRRVIPGGLVRAVAESWYPSNDHDYGLVLEDDVEVSPLFYAWLKYTLREYR